MPSRRDQIRMSEDELRAFLDEQRTLSVATIGPRGRPHLVPLWYVREGDELLAWTFAKSQKARNLERDAHATVQIETGDSYDELRGAMMECDVELERDPQRVAGYGLAVFNRHADGGEAGPEVREMVERQAPKRVGLRFKPTRIVTWDHRKLGGGY